MSKPQNTRTALLGFAYQDQFFLHPFPIALLACCKIRQSSTNIHLAPQKAKTRELANQEIQSRPKDIVQEMTLGRDSFSKRSIKLNILYDAPLAYRKHAVHGLIQASVDLLATRPIEC